MKISPKRVTRNRCWGCKRDFEGLVVLGQNGSYAHTIPGTDKWACPHCGGDYWTWLNYDEFALS